MDPNLDTYRNAAQSASSDAASITESAPTLLSELKNNLTSIFQKDNPMIAARDTALQGYLNTPSATRANLLPGNLPMVAGSNLNLSPTQQNAIVTARQNAALVPLLGLNQSIVSQYGNLGDIIQGAAGIYDAKSRAAGLRANNAMDMYKNAMAEADSMRKANSSSGGILGGDTLAAIIAAMNGGGNGQGGGGRPSLDSFDDPENFSYGPTSGISGDTSQPTSTLEQINQPHTIDDLLGFFGNLWGGFKGMANTPVQTPQQGNQAGASGYGRY